MQFLLGLPLSEFAENDPRWIRNELELKYGKQGQEEQTSEDEPTDEDKQLMREERIEEELQTDAWDLNRGDNDEWDLDREDNDAWDLNQEDKTSKDGEDDDVW